MASNKKHPRWHYLYSFIVFGIAGVGIYELNQSLSIADTKEKYAAIAILITSFIIFAEKLFLWIKQKQDEKGRRNDIWG